MAVLLWDQTGTRFFETGIDRGVLYPASGSPVAWNGLTSIEESFSGDGTEALYLDGIKYYDDPADGDYGATLSAITYPVEFDQYDGFTEKSPGLFLDDQVVGRFGLSYRTLVGNDVVSENLSYRIHILYNLAAIPTDHEYSTISDSVSINDFSWDISGVPEALTGYAPTVHVIADAQYLNVETVKELENILYGTTTTAPRLPLLAELQSLLEFTIRITDNGDGSWTATGPDSLLTNFGDNSFQIDQANATTIDADSYSLTDTP